MRLTPFRFSALLGLFLAFVCSALCSTAFADGGGTVVTGMPPQMLWGLVAAVVAQGVTFTLKRASTWWFFHTTVGSIVLAFVSGVLGTLGPAIQTKGFDKYAILFAVLNFALNFFTTGSATNPAASAAVKARRARVSGGSIGTAKQAALMSLGLILFLGLGAPTCSPGAQALGNCELGKLPQILQAAVVAVVAIAADPSKTADDFFTAGKDLAPGQLDCVVAAVSTSLKARVPSHGQADPLLLAMIKKLDAYSALHPAKACGDRQHALNVLVPVPNTPTVIDSPKFNVSETKLVSFRSAGVEQAYIDAAGACHGNCNTPEVQRWLAKSK